MTNVQDDGIGFNILVLLSYKLDISASLSIKILVLTERHSLLGCLV